MNDNGIRFYIDLLNKHIDNGDWFAASVSVDLIARRVNAAYTSSTLRDAKALLGATTR